MTIEYKAKSLTDIAEAFEHNEKNVQERLKMRTRDKAPRVELALLEGAAIAWRAAAQILRNTTLVPKEPNP